MSSKIAHYLQEHLVGEVLTSTDVRKYFSTDSSVFTIMPQLVVYPQGENDVRKTARFTWQLAERGRVIPITARGLGSDKSGASIGGGIMMVFPAHMNRIVELNGKSGTVVVEPGLNFGKLQQTLHTHGRFLPPFPPSLESSTIGGAVANNTGGEKSLKYGTTLKYVKELRVVLANGEVIETKRINKRELSKKLGLSTFEGEIYRGLDTLIEENQELLTKINLEVTNSNAGYNLTDIKRKDGSFDLTPLFVGSQGTLGIVTEVVLNTEPHNPSTTLIAAFVDDPKIAEEAILEIRKLDESPSAIEMIDSQFLDFLEANNPNQLKDLINKPFPRLVLLIEFDNNSQRVQKRLAKKAVKILEHNEIAYKMEEEEAQKERFWKLRQSVVSVIAQTTGRAKPVPIIEDGIVPPERFQEYLTGLYNLLESYKFKAPIWGHGGTANFYLQPLLDLSQVGDRQKVFRLADDYYRLVISLGGSTCGQYNDGRLRAPYLPELYGAEVYELFQKVKQIFDPYDTLNPGVKINVTQDSVKPLLRHEYSTQHLYDHLPSL